MAFLGKEYKFEKQENFEDFVNGLGLTPEQSQGFINFRPSVTVTKEGDSYTVVSAAGGNKRELNFKSGVTFEEKTNDRTSQTTVTLAGNTITQVQDFGDGAILTLTREFNGDQMVLTLTSTKTNVVARRYYKA